MAVASSPNVSVTSREQKLLFVFTFNLVRAADHLQSTRLLRFLEHGEVLQNGQVREIKAEGTPAGRTIVLLEKVIKNCEIDNEIFKKFHTIVEDKQPSVLRDHMPDIGIDASLSLRVNVNGGVECLM